MIPTVEYLIHTEYNPDGTIKVIERLEVTKEVACAIMHDCPVELGVKYDPNGGGHE